MCWGHFFSSLSLTYLLGPLTSFLSLGRPSSAIGRDTIISNSLNHFLKNSSDCLIGSSITLQESLIWFLIRECLPSGAAECTNRDQIQCGTNHYCVDFSSLCNGADSCEDNTDEEPTLCDVGIESFGCCLGESPSGGFREEDLTPGWGVSDFQGDYVPEKQKEYIFGILLSDGLPSLHCPWIPRQTHVQCSWRLLVHFIHESFSNCYFYNLHDWFTITALWLSLYPTRCI